MIKIYHEGIVEKQITMKSKNFTDEKETTFTFTKDSLIVNSIETHLKIYKNQIKRVKIQKYNESGRRVFIHLKGKIKVEYIFFFDNINDELLVQFFKKYL